MSVDMRFKGTLVFASARACKAAVRALRDDEEGCLATSAVQPDDLRVDGKNVHVDVDCSAPASFFADTCHVLGDLAEAARSGAIEAVYDAGEGPDAVWTERITAGEPEPEPDPEEAWQKAVREGDLAVIERSLAEGRSPTEMLRLTWSGKAVDRLVAAGADLEPGDDPPVVWLAQFGMTDALARLLAAGADPDARRALTGSNALQMAAFHGKVPAIRALLAAGADPNAADRLGDTALHAAVINRGKARRRVVEALLAGGADPTRRNTPGKTAHDVARTYGHADVLDLLAPR